MGLVNYLEYVDVLEYDRTGSSDHWLRDFQSLRPIFRVSDFQHWYKVLQRYLKSRCQPSSTRPNKFEQFGVRPSTDFRTALEQRSTSSQIRILTPNVTGNATKTYPLHDPEAQTDIPSASIMVYSKIEQCPHAH